MLPRCTAVNLAPYTGDPKKKEKEEKKREEEKEENGEDGEDDDDDDDDDDDIYDDEGDDPSVARLANLTLTLSVLTAKNKQAMAAIQELKVEGVAKGNLPEEFTDNYEIKGSLSWGGDLDPLSRCVCRKSGDFFGLKILTKPYPGDIPKLQTQVEALKKLRHPMFLQICGVFESRTQVLILTEMTEGSFFEKAWEGNSENDVIQFIRQLLEAVRCVHSHGLILGDLKPSNLLKRPNSKNNFALASFGLIPVFRNIGFGTTRDTDSLHFSSPESFEDLPDQPAMDLWAIGAITYFLLCGKPPFEAPSKYMLTELIKKGDYEFQDEEWGKFSSDAKDFVRRLLETNPNVRPNATKALSHPWLQEGGKSKKVVGKIPHRKQLTTFLSSLGPRISQLESSGGIPIELARKKQDLPNIPLPVWQMSIQISPPPATGSHIRGSNIAFGGGEAKNRTAMIESAFGGGITAGLASTTLEHRVNCSVLVGKKELWVGCSNGGVGYLDFRLKNLSLQLAHDVFFPDGRSRVNAIECFEKTKTIWTGTDRGILQVWALERSEELAYKLSFSGSLEIRGGDGFLRTYKTFSATLKNGIFSFTRTGPIHTTSESIPIQNIRRVFSSKEKPKYFFIKTDEGARYKLKAPTLDDALFWVNVLVEVKHLLSVDEPQICKLVETDTQPTEGKRGHIVAIENFEGGLIWTMDTQLTMKEWELVPVPKEEKEEGKSDYALVETRKLKIPGSSVPSLFPHPGPVFSITDSEVWASIGDCFGVVELTKDQICLGEVACNQTTNANKSVFTAGVYVAKFGELWVADDGGQIWVWSVVKKSVLHEFLFVNWHEALMLASDSVPLEVRSEKQRDNFTMWTLNRANQIVVSMCENDDVIWCGTQFGILFGITISSRTVIHKSFRSTHKSSITGIHITEREGKKGLCTTSLESENAFSLWDLVE